MTKMTNDGAAQRQMTHFRLPYFVVAMLIFLVEILIALFVKDQLVRPFVGDILVVILLYYLARAFLKTVPWKIAVGVLVFSYIVEALQYVKIVELLGLQHHQLARVVIGTSFSWLDILCYTLGICLVFCLDKIKFATKPR